jgi:hypothetical protein
MTAVVLSLLLARLLLLIISCTSNAGPSVPALAEPIGSIIVRDGPVPGFDSMECWGLVLNCLTWLARLID